jgi:hypothetical protein
MIKYILISIINKSGKLDNKNQIFFNESLFTKLKILKKISK